MKQPDEIFLSELTDCQNRLFAYLVSLLGNVHDARDVLQETNLVMWRRMDTFNPGTSFHGWSRKCAYFQALAFLRDKKRQPSLLNEELLTLIANEEDAVQSDKDEEVLALRDCLEHLSDKARKLIKLRYDDQTSIRNLAADLKKSESAIKMSLMRTRENLQVCIDSKLKEA